jgi:copper transport protein
VAIAAAAVIAVFRWLMLAGLAGALGGMAGRGLARQYKGAVPAPLPAPWALRASLLGAVAAAGLAAVVTGGHALTAITSHPAVAALVTAGQDEAAVVECAAFLLAAVALRWRRGGLAVIPLLGVVAAEGIRAHPEGVVPVAGALLSYCHVLPAVMWAGMLFYTVRAALAWRHDPAALRGLVRLYGNAAAWLFAVVVITGVITALVLVPPHELLHSGYGIILLAKAALIAVTAGLAVAGRAWLGRPGAPGTGPARATRWERYALVAVLAVTAVLTVVPPPAAPARHAPVRAATRYLRPSRHAPARGRMAAAQPAEGPAAWRPPRAQGS